MTNPWKTNADEVDPDANRLGDAWDALIAGTRPTGTEADAELMAVAGQLSTEAHPIRPTLTFRNSLRETLMHSGIIPMTAAPQPPTFHPLPKLGRPVEMGQPIRPSAALPERLRATGMRWAALAATITLLLATAGGGYLATRGPGEGNPTRITGYQFQAGTPVAEPRVASPVAGGYVDPCGSGAPYFPCTGPGPLVGTGYIVTTLYDKQVPTDVTNFVLQSWTIEPGKTLPNEAYRLNLGLGIGLDIVTAGAYAAAFSGPATVSRTGPLATSFYYPEPGTVVELSKGDSVSYAIGTRTNLTNLMGGQQLEFKSVLFLASAAGDPEATPNPASATVVGGVARVIDHGPGALPKALDQYDNGGMQIWLTYSQIDPTRPFPPKIYSGEVVFGPVDPQNGPEGTEGYILWAIQPQG